MGKYTIKTQKLALKLAEKIQNSEEGFVTHEKQKLFCLKDIQISVGPNPLAIARYAVKFGGDISGVPRKINHKNKLTK